MKEYNSVIREFVKEDFYSYSGIPVEEGFPPLIREVGEEGESSGWIGVVSSNGIGISFVDFSDLASLEGREENYFLEVSYGLGEFLLRNLPCDITSEDLRPLGFKLA